MDIKTLDDTAERREFAERARRDSITREATYWGDLARTVGAAPEDGREVIGITNRLYDEMKSAGYETHTFSDAEIDKLWNGVVDKLPVMQEIKGELQAFADRGRQHGFLAGAALSESLAKHDAAEFFRPSGAPDRVQTQEMLDGAERAMRLAGRGVPLDHPSLSSWLEGAAGDAKRGLAALGLSEQHQSAALQLGGQVSYYAVPVRDADGLVDEWLKPSLEDLGAFAAIGENQRVAASYMLNHADLPAVDRENTTARPDWALSVEETQARIEEAIARGLGNEPVQPAGREQVEEERSIGPNMERQQALPPEEEVARPAGMGAAADAEVDTPPKTTEPPLDHQAAPQEDRESAAPEATTAKEANEAAFSVEKGDVPDSLRQRYLLETDKLRGDVAFHRDATSDTPAFRDSGAKLTTRETNMQTISDMVATAAHRGWSEIKVTGEPEFRRAVWLEAQAKGIEVFGYKPTERDKQELDKILDARDGKTIEPVRERKAEQAQEETSQSRGENPQRAATDQPGKNGAPDFDQGVSGVLKEVGSAPYQNNPANEQTAFVRLETPSGKEETIWGVGLPDAVERSGVQVGDQVTVRRDGTEMVNRPVKVTDKATGETTMERRDVPRNRWEVTADRFREASPREAANDPATKDAQSNLKVLETVIASNVSDPALRAKLMETAKAHVADRLQEGRTFKGARVRETRQRAPAEKKATRGVREVVSKAAGKAVQQGRKEQAQQKDRKGPERSRGR